MNYKRRRFLQVSLSSATALALSGCSLDNEKWKYFIGSDNQYRRLLPELFQTPPEVPSHVPIAIIGSGFGGAISALRLGEAGKEVAVIERGNRWPISSSRKIFAHDMFPDGRSFWHRTQSIFPALTYDLSNIWDLKIKSQTIRKFSGVLDIIEMSNGLSNEVGGFNLLLGTGVGGGSLIYTAVQATPQKDAFEKLYPAEIDYDELYGVYSERVKSKLNVSEMPNDIYTSIPFKHSRDWDREIRHAGYHSEKIKSAFDWRVVRDELRHSVAPSATLGLTNFGNSNGVKNDLRKNYIPQAEATENVTIYHNQEVKDIRRNGNGFSLDVVQYDVFGTVLKRTTITCDKLIMGAGSYHTTRMMVNAKAEGKLTGLNEHVGKNWGDNQNKMAFRQGRGFDAFPRFGTQGSPSASAIFDDTQEIPTFAENWANASLMELGISMILSVGIDYNHRGEMVYNASKKDASLHYPESMRTPGLRSLRHINNKIATANNQKTGAPGFNDVIHTGAHPVGGMEIGKATDIYGRVHGEPNLYVMDGSLLPGNTGGANPVLTIASLAERNIEHLIRNNDF